MTNKQEHLGRLLDNPPWQHEQPVALLPHVLRLTAPNPGVMTGPGTNSYLVRGPEGWAVIDPGPLDATHTERLWQVTGGAIRFILCTHSHSDHSPGARPLQGLCAARQSAGLRPPILGLPSAASADASHAFTPDGVLDHGQTIDLGTTPDGQAILLEVVHTPGHAANHLCLLLSGQPAGLLFSGDHILNGSTTVINPPDGNMTAYLDSLDRLDEACARQAIDYILPAHGHVLPGARTAIAKLKAHRLQREDKIRRVMQAQPGGTLEDWLPLAYDDVPPALWPVARRSLLAHIERLREI